MSRPELENNVESSQRPWGVWVIAVVVAIEAALMILAGVYMIADLFVRQPLSLGGAIFLAALCLLIGFGLSWVSWNAWLGFRWTRSAAFVWQLLSLAVMVSLALSGLWWITILMIAPLAVLFLLFTPRVVAFSLKQGNSRTL